MVVSKQDIHPDLSRLVADIVKDFTNNTRPSNNYLDRRIELIKDIGHTGLASVDEQLWEALKGAEIKDENIQQRVTGWAHVLKTHSGQSQ